MRHDLRELFCLYPGGKPTTPEPVSRGRQLSSVLEEYFEETSSRAPVCETRLLVAGRLLRIRFLDTDHNRHLCSAFSHLRHEFTGDGDLTIHVWDGEAAGPASNSLLASYLQTLYRDWTAHCGTRGELRGFHSPSLPAFYMPGPDVINVVDVANAKAYFFKRDASPLPYWEAASPFPGRFSIRGAARLSGCSLCTAALWVKAAVECCSPAEEDRANRLPPCSV